MGCGASAGAEPPPEEPADHKAEPEPAKPAPAPASPPPAEKPAEDGFLAQRQRDDTTGAESPQKQEASLNLATAEFAPEDLLYTNNPPPEEAEEEDPEEKRRRLAATKIQAWIRKLQARWKFQGMADGGSKAEVLDFFMDTYANVATEEKDAERAARSAWGVGFWEANMEGDSLTAPHAWRRCLGSAADEESPEDYRRASLKFAKKMDGGLWSFRESEGRRRCLLKHCLGEVDETAVDFQLLTVVVRIDGRNHVLPLRRVNQEGAQVDPPEGDLHPWYQKRVELKEQQTKSEGDWLTNENFFTAFCQAIEQAGGKVDFSAEDLFDFRFNEDFRSVDKDSAEVSRRGGVLYRQPFGWKKFALRCKNEFDGGDNTWMGNAGGDGEWAVAYHGLPMKFVPFVVRDGFIVGKGQGGNKCKDVRTGGVVGNGVYCSPNHVAMDCYATKWPPAMIEGRTLYFAFQCRVRPEKILRPDRHFARNNDEEVMGIDGAFEWIVNDPKDIRACAVLVREELPVYGMKTLNHLILNNAWNDNHKPLPRGTFDSVAGRRPEDDASLEQSYKHAEEAFGVSL
eukprot:TRINITY_DN18777_c0_g1_i1.p1 TRINITY_DN18777_c0_g1~~TRINITY_DN18777_c0_g1_i1.p1  ORF type:complete len:568 (-),score=144.19 TRINITY_DN18777_c0_g1_i1:380-2083(-)